MADDRPSWMKTASRWADKAQSRVNQNAADLGEQLSRTEAWSKVRDAAGAARVRVGDAAKKAQSKAQEAGITAQKIIGSLGNAPADLDDPVALAKRFLDVLQAVDQQLDQEAKAVSIGYLGGGGVGVVGLTGLEVFYLRPDGPMQAHLRVSQMSGRHASLSVGGSASAYAACFYGPREVLARPSKRRGADVEVLVASLGFLRADTSAGRAGGWMIGLGAGLGLGVPILSSFGAMELEEQMIGAVKLETALSRPLEAVLAGAPDKSWRRKIAKAL